MSDIISQLVREDLINLHVNVDDQSQLLEILSDDLYQKGYVLDSFREAIIKREREFPTGLQLEEIAVAIPHTYAQYIKVPFIYINQLESPISFIQMGTDEEEVQVSYVVVLGISKPQEQTGLLAELMEIFGNTDFINRMQMVNSEKDLYNLFKTQTIIGGY